MPDAPSPQPRDDDPRRRSTLLRAVRAVSGVTLLSRLGGLVRDVLVARIFSGDAAVGSAFAAAFQIPNMFRRLFGEGALSAAFLPEYADAQREDAQRDSASIAADPAGQRGRLATLTIATLGLITSLLVIVIELALLIILLTLDHDRERALSLQLIMVMLPFMPLICAVAIMGGMLQAHDRFAASSTGPVVLNLFIIAVGAFCLATGQSGTAGIAYALAIATVLSGLTQLLWFARLLRPHVRWTRDTGAARARASRMFKKFMPVMLGLGTLQLNAFLDTLIAMWPIWVGPTVLGHQYPLDEASNLILSSTTRLYQFPLGVFGIAVATAAFPLLARHAKDRPRFVETLRHALRLSIFIGLPASIGLVLIRTDLTAVLFGFGRTGWNPDYLARSASVLAGYSVAIWAYSLNHVLSRAFYARGDTRTPMRIALAMVAINLTLNITLIWPLGEAGLAWSTAISAVLQTLVLARLAGTRLLRAGGEINGNHADEAASHGEVGYVVLDRATVAALLRSFVAAVAMAALTSTMLLFWPAPVTWTGHALRCCVTVAIGAVIYAAVARALRLPEFGWLLHGRSAHGTLTGSVHE